MFGKLGAVPETPAFDVPPVRVKVLDRTIDLEHATIRYGLSCGHVWTAKIASHPIRAVLQTLGFPEVDEDIACPSCGAEIPIVHGLISDDPDYRGCE